MAKATHNVKEAFGIVLIALGIILMVAIIAGGVAGFLWFPLNIFIFALIIAIAFILPIVFIFIGVSLRNKQDKPV